MLSPGESPCVPRPVNLFVLASRRPIRENRAILRHEMQVLQRGLSLCLLNAHHLAFFFAPRSAPSPSPTSRSGCQQDAESTEERGASVVGSSSVQEGGDIFGTKAEWKEEKTRAPRPRPGPFYHRTPKTLTIFRSLEESPFYRCLPPSTLSIEEINASSASVCWRRQETPVRPLRVVLLANSVG